MDISITGRGAHLKRKDGRIIIHFDYDCFYASVVEHETPALKTLPLAIQQKQIIVTCNYEARRRGLYKLQSIIEARKKCPDVVIVLGEDLTRFRDASKALYSFLRAFSWNNKVERLGFDEVWMDVTDIIDYNEALLNRHDRAHSFFHLSQEDPTHGFDFNGNEFAGHTWPTESLGDLIEESGLCLRLLLGSHLALHLRHRLEEDTGYTSTNGISTSKLLSKMIGNTNKPKGQTTLLPPYNTSDLGRSNVLSFMSLHDIGTVPWIGYKTAQKLRALKPESPHGPHATHQADGNDRPITVQDLIQLQEMTPAGLEKLLAGPGAARGAGLKVYGLLHGIDDTEVSEARSVPRQISIEDSYVRLDSMEQVLTELKALSKKLIERMRIDLAETLDVDAISGPGSGTTKQGWIGRPRTLRLTTRPRLPLNPDGSRTRTFQRISRSMPCPGFLLNIDDSVDVLAARLVSEAITPLFRRLHPEKSGWNLSLVNVAVVDILDISQEFKHLAGADIRSMIVKRAQERQTTSGTLQESLRTTSDKIDALTPGTTEAQLDRQSGNTQSAYESDRQGLTEYELHVEPRMDCEDLESSGATLNIGHFACPQCGGVLPAFAKIAHLRFHKSGSPPHLMGAMLDADGK